MAHQAKLYIEKLKQAHRDRYLVPFVGAGVSFPMNMPGWGTLIEQICNEFDYEVLLQKKDEIRKLIGDYRYLDAVDVMLQAGIKEDDLKSAICTAIHQQRKKYISENPDNIYKELANMNCTKYLTTNYDNYLSDYVGKGPSDITHLYNEFINELDDEYIQQVFAVGKQKLRARNYILLADISHEKRIELENKYDVNILKYSVENCDHTAGIREVLNEIRYISDKEETGNIIAAANANNHFSNTTSVKIQKLPLISKLSTENPEQSSISVELQEIILICFHILLTFISIQTILGRLIKSHMNGMKPFLKIP